MEDEKIVSGNMNLNDKIINFSQALLKNQFQHLIGL